jgi:hypothetical protein
MGIAAGAGECLAPVTIADVFFLHERGAITAYVPSGYLIPDQPLTRCPGCTMLH